MLHRAGFNPDTGVSYYAGVDVESEGYELEFQGRITENWSLLAGYTNLALTDPYGGDDVRTFVPSRTFNFGTRYRFDQVPGLEAGTTVKWQDDTHLDNGVGVSHCREPAESIRSNGLGLSVRQRWCDEHLRRGRACAGCAVAAASPLHHRRNQCRVGLRRLS